VGKWISSAEAARLAAELERQADADGVTKHIGGAVAIVEGGILVIRRLDTEPLLPSYWELPSGGREPGDTSIIEVLQRELAEETGRPLAGIRKYLGFFDYQTSKHRKVRQWNFLVEVEPGEVKLSPGEHDAYQIFRHGHEVPADLLISAESRKVLMAALEELAQACLPLA
jgi:8-oxo-dGTP diphosphatase